MSIPADDVEMEERLREAFRTFAYGYRPDMPEQPTPKWMKRLVRARMRDTGEKYTVALRAVKADTTAARARYGRGI